MLFTYPPPARCPESQRWRWWAWVSRWAFVNIHSKVYVHMYTYYRQPPTPWVLYTGSARDRQMGSLSQVSPASHSESYILLKEEGAGEKKKAGVWSVIL